MRADSSVRLSMQARRRRGGLRAAYCASRRLVPCQGSMRAPASERCAERNPKDKRHEEELMISVIATPRRALAAISVALLAGAIGRAAGEPATVTRLLAEKLPNVPGKSLTAVTVTFAPGGK